MLPRRNDLAGIVSNDTRMNGLRFVPSISSRWSGPSSSAAGTTFVSVGVGVRKQQIGAQGQRDQQQHDDSRGGIYHIDSGRQCDRVRRSASRGPHLPDTGRRVRSGEFVGDGPSAATSSHAPTPLSHTRYGRTRPRCRTSVPTFPSVNADAPAIRMRVRDEQRRNDRISTKSEHGCRPAPRQRARTK